VRRTCTFEIAVIPMSKQIVVWFSQPEGLPIDLLPKSGSHSFVSVKAGGEVG
jgi:hypothetical protein